MSEPVLISLKVIKRHRHTMHTRKHTHTQGLAPLLAACSLPPRLMPSTHVGH